MDVVAAAYKVRGSPHPSCTKNKRSNIQMCGHTTPSPPSPLPPLARLLIYLLHLRTAEKACMARDVRARKHGQPQRDRTALVPLPLSVHSSLKCTRVDYKKQSGTSENAFVCFVRF